MKVKEGKLPGIVSIEPRIFKDARGHFLELYREERYSASGIPQAFVQDNMSCSGRNVLRGLHYQFGRFPQGKLITVLEGRIWDVALDIRRGSPTFGRFAAEILSSEDYRQLYIPEGFAHGFCVLSDKALVMYKATNRHAPEEEKGILWNDPDLGIDWPVKDPILSEKDRRLPLLSAVDPDDLPLYAG
ncbi:MAG: dTDP-4-dehydrorhamnose 3,5-epimerase [Desulfobacteraceae bacterium]|nr:dTDP-4-dehydrorhamnose 3,5-epimerase [Desulfobacteraceae bacterium]